MKVLFTFTILLMTTLIYSQYNYGLEVEQRDAKIEGKLNLTSGNGNLQLGINAGILLQAPSNTVIGSFAGDQSQFGFENVILGSGAGKRVEGRSNTFLGTGAGATTSGGSYNVFLGYEAGAFENNSHRLYIESTFRQDSNNSRPLIYGEFDTDRAGINWDSSIPLPATLSVNGNIQSNSLIGNGQRNVVADNNGNLIIETAPTIKNISFSPLHIVHDDNIARTNTEAMFIQQPFNIMTMKMPLILEDQKELKGVILYVSSSIYQEVGIALNIADSNSGSSSIGLGYDVVVNANASNFAISLSPSSPIVIDNLNHTYSITLYTYSQANAAAFKFHGFVCQLE